MLRRIVHTFASQALELGAAKVVVDQKKYHQINGDTFLTTSSLTALQDLATYHRKYLNLPIIALTGSNGKTTTKELINAVLSKKYNIIATLGNLNNHIGVPLTLLSMTKETEIGIVEMGANHLKEIELLCTIAQPNYGYITNFGKAHLEGFGSLEGVIKGKSELYTYINNTGGLVFVNTEDEKQIRLTKSNNKYTFSNDEGGCQISLIDAKNELIIEFNNIKIQSNLIGKYNYYNIAAAITIGHYFKVSEKNIKEAIEEYTPTNNRSQIINKKGHTIILDAYNANPSSMNAALENFKQTTGTHKILILGDMFELGTTAKEEHQAIADSITTNEIGDIVYLVGENFSNIKTQNTKIYICSTFEELKKRLKIQKPCDATILIKGSRGMALERVLEEL